jgi:D-aspartate ligase
LKRKVLVLDCGRNGLGLIRSLAIENNYIIGVDFSRTPGLYSKYLKEKYVVINPKVDVRQFVSDLCAIGAKQKEKIFLFPSKNNYIEIFNEYYEELSQFFIPTFLTDPDLYDQCSNKLRYAKLFENSNVKLPRQFNNIDSIEQTQFPLIIKPEKLAANTKGNTVFKIRICNNIEELIISVEDLAGIDYVIQEVIPGGDDSLYTCGVVAIDGSMKACFTGKKVRQFPPLIGEASYAKSVVDSFLVDLAIEICHRTKFTGIAQIEFKYFNGNYYFIEMNPRSFSWNALATYCGVNLAQTCLSELIERSDKLTKSLVLNQREGTWSFFYEDFLHNFFLNKNIGFFKLINQIYSSNVHAYFYIRDLKPAIAYYFWGGINLFKHAIKLKRGL